MTFPDHFSDRAAAYARYRPRYPDALFAWLARLTPRHDLAWDAATGNGQAALGLAAHFGAVLATDASAAQLDHARPHPQVTYRLACAEQSGLDDHGADLVTVAQALHWLDLSAFWPEVRRVLRPGGGVAAWCYGPCSIEPAVDTAVGRFYADVVGPYWSPERRLVETRYRTLPFPFEECPAPPFEMTLAMPLDGLGGYLRTWSATRAYMKDRREDPVPALLDRVREFWGPPDRERLARWPIAVRAGHA